MGNTFGNNVSKADYRDENERTILMNEKPSICIPNSDEMNPDPEWRIRFRARHAATDMPAIVEAHKKHTIAQLKRSLIEHMGFPFPSEDGRCKIMMVANKPDLPRDEATQGPESQRTVNERYLGGSIDHLTLHEYGLTTGDYLMFVVTFPQLYAASSRTLSTDKH